MNFDFKLYTKIIYNTLYYLSVLYTIYILFFIRKDNLILKKRCVKYTVVIKAKRDYHMYQHSIKMIIQTINNIPISTYSFTQVVLRQKN